MEEIFPIIRVIKGRHFLKNQGDEKIKHIVVVGAGYGGITAALRLAKKLRHQKEVQIHLVDKNSYHLLKTQLHEAAVGKRDVVIPIENLLRRRRILFHLSKVKSIDPDQQIVHFRKGQLAFDFLVLALGSKTNFYGIPGLKEHAHTLETLTDAQRIHEHIAQNCALAASEPESRRRKSLLRFIVGGGGLTGVEVAAEFADLVAKCTINFKVNPSEAEIVLIEAGQHLVPHLGEALSARISKELSAKRVSIMTGTKVLALTADAVTLSSNLSLETKTFVWTGGVHIADIFLDKKIKTGHLGRIRVDACLRAENYPFIYAIGDNALAMNPKTGQPVPTAAQFALQQGRLVADNIYAFITGKSCKPYVPRVIGEVISLGGHLAVGWMALPLLKKITFVGFLGSLIKAAIQRKHILLLRKESRNWSMR